MTDIIIPLVTSFFRGCGSLFCFLKLDSKKRIKEEEISVTIILDDFESRTIGYFSQVNYNGVKIYKIFESFNQCVTKGREYIVEKELFRFENYSKPLMDKIDNKLSNRYNLIRQIYFKSLKYGQKD